MTDDGGMMEEGKEMCECRLGGVTAKSLNALWSVVDLRACAGLMGWGGAETNGFRFFQIST